MDSLNIFCVTDKPLRYLEDLNLKLAGVGRRQFSQKYITCLNGKNIQKKEKYYSELTFHYWFWKNKLKSYRNSDWIGFARKEGFGRKVRQNRNLQDLKKKLLPKPKKNGSSMKA